MKVQSPKSKVQSPSSDGPWPCGPVSPHLTDSTYLTHLTPRPTPAPGSWLLTPGSCPRRAFTLIELLVVIAIMAILAALTLTITSTVDRAKKRTRAKTELQEIVLVIENYKTALNFYPPASTNFNINPLYYELEGTTLRNNIFKTLDDSAQLDVADVPKAFLLGGFVNSSQEGGEEGQKAKRFLPAVLQAGQSRAVVITNQGQGSYEITVLGSSIPGPPAEMLMGINGIAINPWRYNPVSPTNNPKSYDLWVDINVGSRIERISNWSDKPTLL